MRWAYFEKLTRAMRGKRLVIIGDPCLDENVTGRAGEVAREAPVLALEAACRVYAPGQATNVASNAAALGADVFFAGVFGTDENGALLKKLLVDRGINLSPSVDDPSRPTTHKVKYVAAEPQRHEQHLFHVYWESKEEPGPSLQRKLRDAVARVAAAADVAVLSDYGNGTLGRGFTRWVINLCARRGIPVVANGRGDLRKFRNADVVVGNVSELELLLGSRVRRGKEMAASLRPAAKILGVDSLVITAGANGMFVWARRLGARHIPSAAVSVVDVTGAGDTVTASLAVALAGGADIFQAADFANLCAATAIASPGTAAPTPAEVAAFLTKKTKFRRN